MVAIQIGRAFGSNIGMAQGKDGHLSDIVIDKDGEHRILETGEGRQ